VCSSDLDLLRGKAVVSCRDYKEVLAHATPTDVVYMDPPYQGVCNTRDHRYSDAVPFDQFVRALDALSQRGVPYIVSYDGRTGQKVHGRWLPETLRLTRLEIRVGRSTQATLLGRDDETFESLYLSADLLAKLGGLPAILRQNDESTLFATA
jgi:DNA adenine methylase